MNKGGWDGVAFFLAMILGVAWIVYAVVFFVDEFRLMMP